MGTIALNSCLTQPKTIDITSCSETFSETHRHNAGTSSDEKDVEQANENAAPQGERKLFAFTQESLKKTCFRRIPSRIGNGK